VRAFVLHGPRQGSVDEVDPPVARPGEVVVDVERVGLCGTDVELYTGEMAYLHQGHAAYPLRPGHEWCGRVASAGEDVDPAWLGRRVIADTMLGCGHCDRCRRGRQHLCEDRHEIGIRGGWPGALAAQLPVPATALHELPATIDVVQGALVEPGANALRAVDAAGAAAGSRVVVWGAGSIGLLCALFLADRGATVHVVGRSDRSIDRARTLGLTASTAEALPALAYDAVIDATDSVSAPRTAVELVEPAGRVVYIGLAGQPSLIDSRALVFKDATAVGILGGSGGLAGAIELYASGRVDPTGIVGATVGLEQVADVLGGWRPPDAGPGPKVHVDPRRA
jgi:2-desacetyl-2-hydroxyethyl bacteriochlorophyllide A dehydrogenase